MNSGETHTDEGAELRTIKGVVQFFWDAGDEERHLLVNIEPESHHIPDAWELFGDHRDSVMAELDEGVTIEITYFVEHHELVDPDGATTHDAERPRIHSARIIEAI